MEAGTRHLQHFAEPADGPEWRCLATKANRYRLAREKSCRFLQDVTLRPEPGDLLSSTMQSRPHRPASARSRETPRLAWLSVPHPAARDALAHIEITCGLSHRNSPVRHQPYGLDLELSAELPSRHIHSPVPWSRSYLRVHETGSGPIYVERFATMDATYGAMGAPIAFLLWVWIRVIVVLLGAEVNGEMERRAERR